MSETPSSLCRCHLLAHNPEGTGADMARSTGIRAGTLSHKKFVMAVAQPSRSAEDDSIDNRRLGSGWERTMSLADDGREMLTAQQVHEITGVPVSTLHDWAAKRERGIDAPGPHHLRLSGRHRRW